MPLVTGTRLGPYEVVEPIGKSEMDEVYRARDTKLERDVAIKVLPGEFANDDERLARFEREAKLLASLNYPNIASIYGFEESDGVRALVLELVEGPTLAERITQGPIPAEEALAIAKQIAEALEAGHEAGVIHRCLYAVGAQSDIWDAQKDMWLATVGALIAMVQSISFCRIADIAQHLPRYVTP